MMQKKVVKASVKATEAKVAETVKEVAKAAEKKAEEISKAVEPVKESAVETAKKTEVDKKVEAVKKTVVKAAAKAAEVKPQLIVQYQNNEVDTVVVEERVKAQFISEGHKASTIKKVSIYIKPEEYSAYYVINDKFSGRVDLF